MDEGMGFATMSLSPRWGAGGFAADNSGVYPSGQRGQTVNLLAYAFRGSNPLTPTSFDGSLPLCKRVVASTLPTFFDGSPSSFCERAFGIMVVLWSVFPRGHAPWWNVTPSRLPPRSLAKQTSWKLPCRLLAQPHRVERGRCRQRTDRLVQFA